MGIFFQQLSFLYNSIHIDYRIIKNQLTVKKTYISFAQDQRKTIVNHKSDINYWKEKLQNFNLNNTIPIDKKRPKINSYHGKSLSFHFSKNITTQLKNYSVESDWSSASYLYSIVALSRIDLKLSSFKQ